jgi:CubicO group peptidase (beta-lactamase class C family)
LRIPKQKVNRFIQQDMKRHGIPGQAVAILGHSKLLHLGYYGYANLEHAVPVKPETIFQSGSVGKMFTATAIMKLLEQKKLKLDASIRTHFRVLPKTWQDITLLHLLTHTAGTGDYPDDFDFRKDYGEDELLAIIGKLPLTFRAGESWSYSNLGYVLLGVLIGKVTGMFYGDYLKRYIFKPAGMTTARVISEADIIPNRAAGYERIKGSNKLKNQEWVAPSLNTTGDGALYLSILDLIKWEQALYHNTILKPPSLEQMWTPVTLNNRSSKVTKEVGYGFGWELSQVNVQLVIEHDGSWQGFTSCLSRYTESGITIIVLRNVTANKNASPKKLVRGIASLLFSGQAKSIRNRKGEKV